MAARRKAARGKTSARSKSAGKGASKSASGKSRSVKRRPATRRSAGKRPAASRASSSSFPEVEELVQLMDAHGLLEVDYETSPDGARRVRVSRAGSPGLPAPAPAAGGWAAAATGGAEPGPPMPDVVPPPSAGEGLHAFESPMVGTFYRAPSPEAAPFVNVGERVDEQSTLCIIEAMKVMNEITPDISGEVVSVEVENGEAVEYGQTLFLIRPS